MERQDIPAHLTVPEDGGVYARPRMPDPVRNAAVRAVIIIALTLSQVVVVLLCTLAGSWLALPMTISSVASTVVATWAVLDIWITRQAWRQRNGVMSVPSSVARRRTSLWHYDQ
ncbi:hypothetical protein ACWD33_16865 [Streptomyces xiamenensis]|nr:MULTISPECIES: hypothetical protein [Streptomyces]